MRAWVTGSAGEANNRRRRESESGQNAEPTPLREDHAWSERHGSEQQMSATRFAAPSFLFAEPALTVGRAAGSRKQPCFAVQWSREPSLTVPLQMRTAHGRPRRDWRKSRAYRTAAPLQIEW